MVSRRTIVIAVVLVCVLALAACMIVQAQNDQRTPLPQPDQRGPRPGMDGPPCPARLFAPPPAPMMQMLARELQLTEQQRQQATELVGALADKIRQITGERNPMRELVAEMKAETTKPERVREFAAQASKQEAAVLQAELEMWMRFEQMLTPEQRAKFWTIFPRQAGPMGPPPGMPGGPGAPRAPGEPPTAPEPR